MRAQTDRAYAGGPDPQQVSRLLALGLAILPLAAYAQVWRNGFILFDDPDYVTDNPVVQSGWTWAGVKWAFTAMHSSNWHPLTWLSHMTDCELFGLDAGAQHLVNVLFHVVNSLLLFVVLLRMTRAQWPSAFVAALFALHPLHVESVAWIAERKDVLSTLFWWLTLLAYARYLEEVKASSLNSKVSGEGAKGPASSIQRSMFDVRCSMFNRWYWLALGLFALGLMSKPMLVTLPFALLLLDYWPLRRMQPGAIGKLIWEKIPFFALTIASCVITVVAQRAEAVVGLNQYPLPLRLGNVVQSYAMYLWKTVCPIRLSVIYPLPAEPSSLLVAGGAILLAAICAYSWRVREKRPHLLMGWLWFLGTLVPVIGIVQVGSQAMADRFTYVPLVGIFIILAFDGPYWASRLNLSRRVTAIAAGLMLAGCLAATEFQLTYWRDNQSLFSHALAVTENNPLAHVNLGVTLEAAGQRDRALQEYLKALRINPDLAQAHNNVANLLDAIGKPDEALAHYRAAVRLKPRAPVARDNLGTMLVKLGQYDEAMRQYAKAAELGPNDPRPHYLMGKALLAQDKTDDAIAQFRAALKIDPNDIQSLAYLARVLSSSEDTKIRDGAEAVALAEKANLLSGGSQPQVLDALAMAYAEARRFTEAQQTIQKAIDLANAVGEKKAAATFQERLLLYQAGKAFREPFGHRKAG